MKLSTNLVVDDLREVVDAAPRLEKIGFETLCISERKHNPFLQLAVAATVTKSIKIGPEVALAFPRNPMVLAYTAWDLQRATNGRFILGLGTQVKAHNERRFSLKWEHPNRRFREYILAIRSIWDTFQNRTPLNFSGEFFQYDLMTPMFDPGPLEVGAPPIFVGAVNPKNCQMAGELADGFHCHGFHTEKTLKANVISNIEKGLALSGRARANFTITAPVMAIMGDNKKEIDIMRERVRGMVAFYGATSYYKNMFEAHGCSDTFNRLLTKSRRNEWDEMPKEISDDMLSEFAVEGFYGEIPELLHKKYGDMLDEVLIYFGEPEKGDAEIWKELVQIFKVHDEKLKHSRFS